MNLEQETKRLHDLCTRAATEQIIRVPVEEPKPLRASFSKLTPAQRGEILRRYQAGDRPVDIARDFGVTEWTVQNVRKRAGVPTRPHGLSDADVARAIELQASGLSMRKITAAIGRDAKTIAKYLSSQLK